ncbi:hypothetical protein P9112_002494 [Eukaryota sp. TZLM1-RC]
MKSILFIGLFLCLSYATIEASSNSIQCSTCEWFIGTVQSKITEDTSKEEIVQYLQKACQHVPSGLQPMCEDFFERYTPQLVDLLVERHSAVEICTKLGLCKLDEETVAFLADDDNGIINYCSVCKKIVSYAEEWLVNESTEATVSEFLAKVCTYLPSKMQDTCRDVVSTYYPQLLEMLVTKFDPDFLCELLRICDDTSMQLAEDVPSVNGISCSVCKWIVSNIESKISEDSTKEEIIEMVEKVCNYVPKSMHALCLSMIEEYGAMIIDLLVSRFPPDVICQTIGLCPVSNNMNSIQCSVCTWIIGTIEAKISDETTEEQIIEFVEQVCNFVPQSMKVICRTMIEEYGHKIIEMMVDRFPPNVVCEAIHLCPKQPVSLTSDNSIQCSVCTWIIGTIEAKISEETTEQQIIEFVEQVCNFVPQSMKTLCINMIEEYGHKIIEMMVDRFPPNVVCEAIHLCPQEPAYTDVNGWTACTICKYLGEKVKLVLSDRATVAEIVAFVEKACDYVPVGAKGHCQDFIEKFGANMVDWLVDRLDAEKVLYLYSREKVKLVLSDRATVAEIVAFVEKACDYVPVGAKGHCQDFIEKFGANMVDWLVDRLDAEKFCTFIRVCEAQELETSDVNGWTACTICKYLGEKVKLVLSDRATVAEIVAFVEKACDYVPVGAKGHCQDFIEKFGANMVDWLVDRLDAEKFCTFIRVCEAQELETSDVNGWTACTICKYLGEKVKLVLSDRATVAEIVAFVEKACDYVPVGAKGHCQDFIEKFGANMVDWLVDRLDAEKFCTFIRVCETEHHLQSQDNGICKICHNAGSKGIEFVEKLKEHPELFEKLCDLVEHPTEKFMCKSLIKASLPNIVDSLIEHIDIDQLCHIGHFC